MNMPYAAAINGVINLRIAVIVALDRHVARRSERYSYEAPVNSE
jgi:hypothetical protein